MARIFALLVALYQLNAFADHLDAVSAQDAFMKDETVKTAILSAQEQNLTIEDEIGLLFLKGSCGFAGCFDTYLVSVALHQKSAINPQSQSIIAKVTLLNGSGYKVEILDCDQL